MDLCMSTRPGYTGALNGVILERINFLSSTLGLPELAAKFPHLHVPDGSWHRQPRFESGSDSDIPYADYIDHTLLKQEASKEQLRQLCDEAKQHHFKAVCVNSARVPLCVSMLAGSGVGVACTVGFPLGASSTTNKVAEAKEAVAAGATEIDYVLNVGELKDGNYAHVLEEMKQILVACPAPQITVKIILEVCLLTVEEIIDVCILAVEAGVSYVKTSTGFNAGGGATPESIDVMLTVVGNAALVKASGGVRDRNAVRQYILAGVSRVGTSSGVSIVSNAEGCTAPTADKKQY